MLSTWVDSHCHLDAPELAADVDAVRDRARARGVGLCVLPAVQVAHFSAARELAHRHGDAYALGIHPLYVSQAADEDLDRLDEALTQWHDDPHLVAVGEIGLDYFVPELCEPPLRERQAHFYEAQLRMARRHGLPVILHVRRSADALLQGMRRMGQGHRWSGIAHAFNGSAQQAQSFIGLGLKLGFGGAMTYDRAHRLRGLASTLPPDALVMETDSPDMPPHWLYANAGEREAGRAQGRNEPGELPRIAQELAQLRGISLAQLQQTTTANLLQALPRCRALLPAS